MNKQFWKSVPMWYSMRDKGVKVRAKDWYKVEGMLAYDLASDLRYNSVKSCTVVKHSVSKREQNGHLIAQFLVIILHTKLSLGVFKQILVFLNFEFQIGGN